MQFKKIIIPIHPVILTGIKDPFSLFSKMESLYAIASFCATLNIAIVCIIDKNNLLYSIDVNRGRPLEAVVSINQNGMFGLAVVRTTKCSQLFWTNGPPPTSAVVAIECKFGIPETVRSGRVRVDNAGVVTEYLFDNPFGTTSSVTDILVKM